MNKTDWRERFEKRFCFTLSWDTPECKAGEPQFFGSLALEISKRDKLGLTEENIPTVKNIKAFIAQELEAAREESKAIYGSASGRLIEDIARKEERERIKGIVESMKIFHEEVIASEYDTGHDNALQDVLSKIDTK